MKTADYKSIKLPMSGGDICIEYGQAKDKLKQVRIIADQCNVPSAVIAWIALLGGEKPCAYWLRSISGEKTSTVEEIRNSEAGIQACNYRRWAHPEMTDDEIEEQIRKAIEAAEDRAAKQSNKKEVKNGENPAEATMSELKEENSKTVDGSTPITLTEDEAETIANFFDYYLLSYIKDECNSLREIIELTAIYEMLNSRREQK